MFKSDKNDVESFRSKLRTVNCSRNKTLALLRRRLALLLLDANAFDFAVLKPARKCLIQPGVALVILPRYTRITTLRKHRAVPGHRFGLNLSLEDRNALIAFLNTL
ncbi:hypothetical protein L0156_03795 [bacterium]|nr:hypothetical protein [bacterium]